MLKGLAILACAAAAMLGGAAVQATIFNFSFIAPVVQFGSLGDTLLGSGLLFADDQGAGVFAVTGASGVTTIQGYEADYAWDISGGEGTVTLGSNGLTADGLTLFGNSGPGFYGFSLNPGGSTYAIQLGEVGAPEGTLTITAVPEPASWALLIAGFGVLGVAMRRRNARMPVCLA